MTEAEFIAAVEATGATEVSPVTGDERVGFGASFMRGDVARREAIVVPTAEDSYPILLELIGGRR